MTIELNPTYDDAVRLLLAVEFTIKDLQNTVMCCPDRELYKNEIAQYSKEIDALGTLHHSIHAAIQAESQKCKLILPN